MPSHRRSLADVRRIDTLTGVRAVAALWVVLFHLNQMDTPVHDRLGSVVAHGLFGVDIFFVLSGFVLSMVYVPRLPKTFTWSWYRHFIGRRFAKIYPMHLLTLLAVIALFEVAQRIHLMIPSPSDTVWSAVCSALMLHAFGLTHWLSWNMQSWSVSAEWFAYAVLFTPMVYLLESVRTRVLCAGMVLLLCGMGSVSLYTGSHWTGFTTSGVLRIIPEFLSGYLLHRVLRGRTLRHGDLLTGCGAMVIALVCYVPYVDVWLLVPGVMTLLAGLYAGGPLVNRLFGNSVMVALGDASYSMYLTQWIVILVLKQLLHHAGWDSGFWPSMLIVTAVPVMSMLVGLGSFRWVEEPLRQRLLRLFDAKRGNPENAIPPTAPGLQADTQVSATAG